MRPRSTTESLDAQVARLAREQLGAFTYRQVLDLGGSRSAIGHRLDRGRWIRAAPSVLVLSGTRPSWLRSLMVACLTWGQDCAVSHLAAFAVWGLPGSKRGSVDLTVPRGRKRVLGGVKTHTTFLPAVDVTIRHGIPVTTPARTLIDIAPLVDEETLEIALDAAIRRGLLSVARLRWRLDELAARGRPGVGILRSLLEERNQSVPHTVFETRLLRKLRAAGLPPPTTQYSIRELGRQVARVDFAYPDARLIIEADGYESHSGRVEWESDLARRNEITRLGWRIFHVTWRELRLHPDRVVAMVRAALTPA